jgi:hypothetical protein
MKQINRFLPQQLVKWGGGGTNEIHKKINTLGNETHTLSFSYLAANFYARV